MRLLGSRSYVFVLAWCCNADVQHPCLDGDWDDIVWATGGSLPDAISASRCLAENDVLFVGGSTTRELFDQAVTNLGLQEDDVQRQYCDLDQGFGCYDCVRGCHNSFYLEGNAPNWADKIVLKPDVRLHFSWKPELYTLDDVQLLTRRAQSPHPAAIVMHKGVHAGYNWVEGLASSGLPMQYYEEEVRARAKKLIQDVTRLFPNTTLLWRDAYFHHSNAEIEDVIGRLRDVTTPLFRNSPFLILPGYKISHGAPVEHLSPDGVHQTSHIKDVVLSMLACVICSD